MSKKYTDDFNQKTQGKKRLSGDFHPSVVEMVKLLARISAERDYNQLILKKESLKKELKADD